MSKQKTAPESYADSSPTKMKPLKPLAKHITAKSSASPEQFALTPYAIKAAILDKLDESHSITRYNIGTNWAFSICLTSNEKFAIIGCRTEIVVFSLGTRTVTKTFQKAHSSRINYVVVAKDDDTVYSCSQDGTIKMWSIRGDKPGVPFPDLHNNIIYGIALTPDEKYLLSGSADRSIKVWDLSDGNKCVQTKLNAHEGFVYDLIVTKDCKLVISCSQDRSIKVWTFGTFTLLHTFAEVHFGNVLSIKLSRDEKMIYSTGTDGLLCICDLSKKEKVFTFPIAHGNSTWGVNLTNDDRFIITSSSDRTVRVWDAQTRLLLHTFKNFEEDIYRLRLTKDNRFAIAPAEKGSLYIIDFGARLERNLVPKAHLSNISEMKITNDDKILVTASHDGAISLWDLETYKLVHKFTKPGAKGVTCIAISPDNQKIASGNTLGEVDLWGLQDKKHLLTYKKKHCHNVSSIVFSRDGTKLVSCSLDNVIMFREVNSMEVLVELMNPHRGWIISLTMTMDDKYVISGSADKSIGVWSMETKSKVFMFENAHDAAIWKVQVTHDNRYLLSSGIDHTVRIWDLQTKKSVYVFKTDHRILNRSLTLSKDDGLLVSTDDYGTLEIYNLHSKQRVYIDPTAQTRATAITSDNSRILFSDNLSIRMLENPFHKLTVQYSERCSPFSLLRFMPLTCFFTNYNMDYKRSLIKSYPELLVYPYGWNWFHIVALFAPFKEMILACYEAQIPFTTDSFGKTALHYLLDNKDKDLMSLHIVLTRFGINLAKSQRPSALIDSLSDIFQRLVELDSASVVSFLGVCVREPEPELEETLDVVGTLNGDSERTFCLSNQLLYSHKIRECLLTEGQSQKISLGVLPFSWDYSITSDSMMSLVKTLLRLKNQDIFEAKAISLLVEYLWRSSKSFFYFLAAFYSIQAILISVYAGFGETNLGLEIAIFVMSVLFIVYEGFELFSGGFLEHFNNMWNCIDTIGILLVPATIIVIWTEVEGDAKDWLMSFVLTFTYLRWISYFRIFQQTRKLMTVILEIILDIRSFAFVLGMIIFGLSLIFLQFDRETSYPVHLLNSYQLLYSNFDTDGLSTGAMFFLLILVAVFCIVLLNMLISIMGNTFGQVQEKGLIIDSKEVLGLVLENMKICRALKFFKQKQDGTKNESEKKNYLYFAEEKIETEHSTEEKLEDQIGVLKEQLDRTNQHVESLMSELKTQKELQVHQERQLETQNVMLEKLLKSMGKMEAHFNLNKNE